MEIQIKSSSNTLFIIDDPIAKFDENKEDDEIREEILKN